MSDKTILVQAQGLAKRYQATGEAVQALADVSLAVRAGELVALVGPTGTVALLGQPLHELNSDGVTDLRSQAVGFIYQNYNLFPGFTVRENIGLPLRLMLRPPFDAQQRSGQLLAEFNILELANRYPTELSGGQQQLVAIARALAANPPLILADEPTANLDSSAARQIVARLRALADSGEQGVLLATHDLRTASQADRVLTLRDGQIVKETLLQPGRTTRDVLAELA
jgi:ABC-type lipoprotein export system ATPase subunit